MTHDRRHRPRAAAAGARRNAAVPQQRRPGAGRRGPRAGRPPRGRRAAGPARVRPAGRRRRGGRRRCTALFWVFAPQNPYEADAAARPASGTSTHAAGARLAGPGRRCCCCPRSASGSDPAWPCRWSSVGVGVGHPLAAGRRRRSGSAGGRPPGRAPADRCCAGRGRHRRWCSSGPRAILVGPAKLGGTTGGLVAALVVVAGLALVSGPWWLRMARDLVAERSARIREQERAEVAAHVHDSVLHTLTLIQRHVDDPREVTRLARAAGARAARLALPAARRRRAQDLAAALERAAAEVEDAHGVADRGRGRRRRAAGRAARGAAARRARGNGQRGEVRRRRAPMSVYAEVEPEQVTVFVRDRGPGFDLDAVPEDRLGLRQSVVGRMARATAAGRGGRQRRGEGTEVQLEMPRARPASARMTDAHRPRAAAGAEAGAGRARRRPPDVPHRRAGRARATPRRGRRRGRGRRLRRSR